MRTDVVNAQKMMELHLDEAESALKATDLETAKRELQGAEREIEKLEKFIGR